ncbi:MAG TPA: methylmalonyl-CoA epimerase [Candidatus Cloacimonetes bacterium]|nr:methylmalonyl-CoA epimerase [Candidatus Cloacimonadota bacterium]HHE40783.1 methylmalonyl-CoA epimerase [Candidatus Cloacimonadota bacterium]
MIKKINHIGIAVPNLDEAIETYKNLGFSIQSREFVPSQKVEVAMIQIGQSHIELLQPTAEDSPIAKFIEKKGPGIHHLAVSVDDIEKVLHEYEQKGVRMIDTVPRDGAHGTKIAFIHPKSTNGVLLELCMEA